MLGMFIMQLFPSGVHHVVNLISHFLVSLNCGRNKRGQSAQGRGLMMNVAGQTEVTATRFSDRGATGSPFFLFFFSFFLVKLSISLFICSSLHAESSVQPRS